MSESAGQLRHLVIEEAVIHALDHFALQNLLQLLQIEHHTCDRIRFAGHRDFENVVLLGPCGLLHFPKIRWFSSGESFGLLYRWAAENSILRVIRIIAFPPGSVVPSSPPCRAHVSNMTQPKQPHRGDWRAHRIG